MLRDKDPLNVVITGVGGQGNVIASQVLGRILLDQGRTVTIGETLGLSQRGGSVMSHVRASTAGQLAPIIPEGQGQLVVGLEPVEGLRVLAPYGNPETLMVLNTRPVHPIDVAAGLADYPELGDVLAEMKKLCARVWTVEATDIALEMGNPILANIVMLGAVEGSGVLEFGRGGFEAAARELLPADKIEINLGAFDRGRATVTELA